MNADHAKKIMQYRMQLDSLRREMLDLMATSDDLAVKGRPHNAQIILRLEVIVMKFLKVLTFGKDRASENMPTKSTSKTATVPQEKFRFIAIDVETANSDPSSICQIGLAFVDEGIRSKLFAR